MKLLVPVSYFRGSARSELWRLDTEQQSVEFWRRLPDSTIAVRGKGVTGICPYPTGGYTLCDFNRVLQLDTDGHLVKQVSREDFNDLHAITPINDGFLLANTGRDQVERLNLDFSLREHFDALDVAEAQARLSGEGVEACGYYDGLDEDLAFCRRRLADKFHLNHVLVLPDGRTVASSLTERCYLDVLSFKPISNRLQYPPHDGLLHQGCLWITTVNGELLVAGLAPILNFQSVFDLRALMPWQGWCRGLYIQDERLFVAITAIDSLNRRTEWLTVSPDQTRSGVVEICLETLQLVHFYDLSHEHGARVFGMTEYQPC